MFETFSFFMERFLSDPLWVATQPFVLIPTLLATFFFCYAQWQYVGSFHEYVKLVSALPRTEHIEKLYVYRAHESLSTKMDFYTKSSAMDVFFLAASLILTFWTTAIIFGLVVITNYRYFALMSRAQVELDSIE